MKYFFSKTALSLFLFVAVALSNCKKDDTPTDPNVAAKTTIVGHWDIVKLVSNGTDISSTSGGSFDFSQDDTFTAVAIDNGGTIDLAGTYSFSNSGKTLTLVSGLIGTVAYQVNKLEASDAQLQITLGLETRIADMKKK